MTPVRVVFRPAAQLADVLVVGRDVPAFIYSAKWDRKIQHALGSTARFAPFTHQLFVLHGALCVAVETLDVEFVVVREGVYGVTLYVRPEDQEVLRTLDTWLVPRARMTGDLGALRLEEVLL